MQALLEALANAMGKRSGGYSADDDAETSLLREDDPRRRYYADAAMEGPIPTPRPRPAKANAGISKTTYDMQRGERAAENEVERAVEGKGQRYMKGGADESDAGETVRARNANASRKASEGPGESEPDNDPDDVVGDTQRRVSVEEEQYPKDVVSENYPDEVPQLRTPAISPNNLSPRRPVQPSSETSGLGDVVGQILGQMGSVPPPSRGFSPSPVMQQSATMPPVGGMPNLQAPPDAPPAAPMPPQEPQGDILSQIKAAIAGGPQGAQAGSDLQKRLMDLITQGTNAVFPRS